MDKTVYHISVSDVDDWFLKEVFAIMDDVWPPKENKIIPFAKRKNDYLSKYHDGHLFVMKHHGRIVSHAGIFPRQITVGKIPCDINALASVCVLKEHQGNQLGAAIVRHTFDFIMKSTIPRTLYQTGVPDFYKKLGAAILPNRVINSRNTGNPTANPFWEPYIMEFPEGSFDRSAIIDLCGSGY